MKEKGLDFISMILSRKDNNEDVCVFVCVCMFVLQNGEHSLKKGTNVNNQMYCSVLLEDELHSPRLVYANLDQKSKKATVKIQNYS